MPPGPFVDLRGLLVLYEYRWALTSIRTRAEYYAIPLCFEAKAEVARTVELFKLKKESDHGT